MIDEFELPIFDVDGWLEIETAGGGLYGVPAGRVAAVVLEDKPPTKKK